MRTKLKLEYSLLVQKILKECFLENGMTPIEIFMADDIAVFASDEYKAYCLANNLFQKGASCGNTFSVESLVEDIEPLEDFTRRTFAWAKSCCDRQRLTIRSCSFSTTIEENKEGKPFLVVFLHFFIPGHPKPPPENSVVNQQSQADNRRYSFLSIRSRILGRRSIDRHVSTPWLS